MYPLQDHYSCVLLMSESLYGGCHASYPTWVQLNGMDVECVRAIPLATPGSNCTAFSVLLLFYKLQSVPFLEDEMSRTGQPAPQESRQIFLSLLAFLLFQRLLIFPLHFSLQTSFPFLLAPWILRNRGGKKRRMTLGSDSKSRWRCKTVKGPRWSSMKLLPWILQAWMILDFKTCNST